MEGREDIEELLVLWCEAVKKLRSCNGLEFGKYSNSEYQFGSAAVKEICKLVPPILEWEADHIEGYERLCEVHSGQIVLLLFVHFFEIFVLI